MKIKEFAIRLSIVKLSDLHLGYDIVNTLNIAVNENSLFSIDNDGSDLLSIYSELPSMLKIAVDAVDILPENRLDVTIREIETRLIHLNYIDQKNEDIVEANLRTILSVIGITMIISLSAYRISVDDIVQSYPLRFEGLVIRLIENIYLRESDRIDRNVDALGSD